MTRGTTQSPTPEAASVIRATELLLRQRSKIVHHVPYGGILDPIAPWLHREIRWHAVLDHREDLAISAAPLPFLVGEVRCGRADVAPRTAFGVDAVAYGAVARIDLLARRDR